MLAYRTVQRMTHDSGLASVQLVFDKPLTYSIPKCILKDSTRDSLDVRSATEGEALEVCLSGVPVPYTRK